MPVYPTPEQLHRVCVPIAWAVDFLSLVSCIWLLCKLRRLPAAQRRRLFPRQVLVLAVSDLCMALVWYLFAWRQVPRLVFGAALSWTYHATLLAELHIVLGFAAQVFGAREASRCLSWCLGLPWLLAAILTAFEIRLGDGFLAAAAFATCVFSLALLTFAAVLLRAHSSNTAIARRSWRRAAAYTGNFLLTFAPVVCAILVPDSNAADAPLLLWVGHLTLHLNGFINALTYFAQSRYSRVTAPSHKAQIAAQSLVVRFDGASESPGDGSEDAWLSASAQACIHSQDLMGDANEDKV